MNVTIEKVSSIKRKLTVELPEQQALDAQKKYLIKYTSQIKLKGFRPGKAPRNLVAKIYSEEIRREVLEELVQETVPMALQEHDLHPVGLPMLESVDYEEGKPFQYSVIVELKPQFETPAWQGLALEKLRVDITDKKVDKKLEEIRLSLSTVSKVEEDRPLEDGDLAQITYQTFEGDKEITDVNPGPFTVELGRDEMMPGFTESLIGMRVGEVKDITVTMPETARNTELAGKTVLLRTTLQEISCRELPDLDDELAKDLGVDDVETLSGLRIKLHDDMAKEKIRHGDDMINRQLTKILADMVDIEVPTVMVENELSNKVETMKRNFKQSGIDFKQMGIDVDMLRERFRPEAEKSVTAALVLDQIGRDNQVEISSEELDEELVEMGKEYGQGPEMIRSFYESRGILDSLKEGLRIAKTLDLIRSKAEIVEVDILDPEKLSLIASGDSQVEETKVESDVESDVELDAETKVETDTETPAEIK